MLAAVIPMLIGAVSMDSFSHAGLIMLIALVSKHGILIDEFSDTIQVNEEFPPTQAIVKTACLRLRPLLMASLSTNNGIMPLVIGSSASAANRPTTGTNTVSDCVIAILFRLLVLPVKCSYFARDRYLANDNHLALKPMQADAQSQQ
jgi:multidrug efflux pump